VPFPGGAKRSGPLGAAIPAVLVAACALLMPCCASGPQPIFHPRAAGAKGETFGYRKWLAEDREPKTVIIALHGFCGAPTDYSNLGDNLLRWQPSTALYAYELRGQGGDPLYARRGDIGSPAEWYRDLFAFTGLVRDLHPDARILWFGESMGALIACHAFREAPSGEPPCDGLILSSPIVRFRDDIPAWTPALVQAAATALPLARVSVEALSGGQQIQMTEGSVHSQQAKKNPYHVEQHTLRLIGALARLIDGMNACAAEFDRPVLVLHGGKDFFNSDSDVRGFVARIPAGTPASYRNYPDAHHLLMFDEEKSKVFRDIRRWVARQEREKRR
jgi:alpha-beta hydrolase superfamily lysophospholipase